MLIRTRLLIAALLVTIATFPAAGRAQNPRGPRPADAPSRVAKTLPALVPVPADALTGALRRGAISEGRYALDRARSLFRLGVVRERYGKVNRPDPRAATMILRDLAVRQEQLSDGERRAARRVLARPSDGGADPAGQGWIGGPGLNSPLCNTTFCLHWTDTAPDAPPIGDSSMNGIPDWVDTVQAQMQTVWDAQITTLGYRAPKSDSSSSPNGGNGLVDIYLAQLGNEGIYGYCTTDDPNAMNPSYTFYDMSAYCVIDNDFAVTEFPTAPLASLQVTLAHEFHHAVQFAYDLLEDLWFIEGAATAIEDVVFDDANDNYQYFPVSALVRPKVPVDTGDAGFQYGAWVFFGFLREYFAPTGDALLRRAWEYADGAPGGPDRYSVQAIGSAIAERGTKLRYAFADFGAVNVRPAAFYEEGAAYPIPATSRRHRLSSGSPAIGQKKVVVQHLSNFLVSFVPGSGMGRGDRLRVTLDLPKRGRGSEATLVVIEKDGDVRRLPIALSSAGDGGRRVNFNRKVVDRVILVLTNASSRFTGCFFGTPWSCSGFPRDDGQPFRYTARAG